LLRHSIFGCDKLCSTPSGPIRELLANAERLVSAEAVDPASPEGTIRLCGSDYLQHAVIVPLIRALRRRAPRLKVVVSSRPGIGVTDLMARGEIDLCFSITDVADPDLPAQRLYRDHYVCIGRKDHPLKGRRVGAKELCSFDHLLVDPTGLDAACGDRSIACWPGSISAGVSP
jgi:DNA-binding transcriptional LysR family regulator